ncbi:MAG: hypothetical protein JWL98_1347 [Xanthomonadaceae bacterium]|nr:hypothetical protein [Xanthomonadaceae bacterium]
MVANAVNFCQAFTPGVTNTIRNRVIGAENVGTAAIAVACNLHLTVNDSDPSGLVAQQPTALMYTMSNGTASDVTVSCTLLTGTPGLGLGDAYTATHNVVVPANSLSLDSFTVADNPNVGATSLGNYIVGINCLLPPHVSLNFFDLQWSAEDGVGT